MKRIVALLLVFAALVSFAACGAKEEAKTDEQKQQETKKETTEQKATAPAPVVTPEADPGTTEGATYTDGYGRLKLTLPDETWTFSDKKDYPETSGITYDMMATEPQNGSTVTVSYKNTLATPEQHLAAIEKEIGSRSGMEMEAVTEKQTVTLNGVDYFHCVYDTEAAGRSSMEYYYLSSCEEGIIQILHITMTNTYDAEDMVALFSINK